MNSTTSLWRCRSPSCGLKGNAADYLAALRNYTRSEAMRILQERYGGPEISAEPGALETEVGRIRRSYEGAEEDPRIAITEDEYLDRFAIHWPTGGGYGDLPDPMSYMLGRGFESKTLNEWNIGYDDRSNRVTIPVRDNTGVIVGVKARAWCEDTLPKYLSLGDKFGDDYRSYGFHTYMKSMHVFGLDRAQGNELLVVEGELNVIAMHQMGMKNAVAVAGAEFSERQRELILSATDSATIYFDDDPAGQAGVKKVAENLSPWIPIRLFWADGDAADAIDPRKSFSREALEHGISTAPSSLLSYLPTS